MKIIDGIPVFGEADENTMTQMRTAVKGAARGALMADNHLGYAVPIGGVLAYDYAVSPSGVGYDIACGNRASRTDFNFKDGRMRDEAKDFWIRSAMDDIWRTISFGMGRKNAEPVDHELFDDPAWQIPVVRALRDKAAAQLGTVGSGNHYVDLFEDEDGYVWIGVHFGSRGFGHGIATAYLDAGGAQNGMMAEPLVLSTESNLGSEYLEAMELAGRYAYAGRDWVVERVAQLLNVKVTETVHNHHNFAWKETHDGREMWVVRKGATPAYPGQRGFVGGSMGDSAVILEGRGSTVGTQAVSQIAKEQEASMFSTVHGAGRAMSRTAAAGKVRRGKLVTEGRISSEFGIKDPWALSTWLRDTRGVVLRGAGLDEAPQAYKRLPDVLAEHAATVRILHALRPLGVAMAGPDVRDPYKD
jgi:tRNA-splicing ligase RtcB (3'-phosphate/5'-hydroxy nucleic acid ligase)